MNMATLSPGAWAFLSRCLLVTMASLPLPSAAAEPEPADIVYEEIEVKGLDLWTVGTDFSNKLLDRLRSKPGIVWKYPGRYWKRAPSGPGYEYVTRNHELIQEYGLAVKFGHSPRRNTLGEREMDVLDMEHVSGERSLAETCDMLRRAAVDKYAGHPDKKYVAEIGHPERGEPGKAGVCAEITISRFRYRLIYFFEVERTRVVASTLAAPARKEAAPAKAPAPVPAQKDAKAAKKAAAPAPPASPKADIVLTTRQTASAPDMPIAIAGLGHVSVQKAHEKQLADATRADKEKAERNKKTKPDWNVCPGAEKFPVGIGMRDLTPQGWKVVVTNADQACAASRKEAEAYAAKLELGPPPGLEVPFRVGGWRVFKSIGACNRGTEYAGVRVYFDEYTSRSCRPSPAAGTAR